VVRIEVSDLVPRPHQVELVDLAQETHVIVAAARSAQFLVLNGQPMLIGFDAPAFHARRTLARRPRDGEARHADGTGHGSDCEL
jgi:hypothetical protein